MDSFFTLFWIDFRILGEDFSGVAHADPVMTPEKL